MCFIGMRLPDGSIGEDSLTSDFVLTIHVSFMNWCPSQLWNCKQRPLAFRSNYNRKHL